MSETIEANDPLSTAAAALRGAEALAPLLRCRLPMLLPEQWASECARLADVLDDEALFERSTLAALRELLGTIEGAIDRTVVERLAWVPVRCLDGDEEFEEITVRTRDARGDALASIAAKLGMVIELVAQTVALRRAAQLLARSQ